MPQADIIIISQVFTDSTFMDIIPTGYGKDTSFTFGTMYSKKKKNRIAKLGSFNYWEGP